MQPRRTWLSRCSLRCAHGATAGWIRFNITASLAVCFGLQNSTVRKLPPADLTTTVLPLTITGLAADSVLGGGTGAKAVRRLGSIAAMLVGAGAAALLLRVTMAGVIACAAAFVAVAAGTFRYAPGHSKSAAPADAVPAPYPHQAAAAPGSGSSSIGVDDLAWWIRK